MKLILAVGFLLAFATGVNAQKQRTQTYLPKIAIKTNALYWATSTPNLGLEIGLAKKLTLDISGNYNPWKFSDNKQLKHWLPNCVTGSANGSMAASSACTDTMPMQTSAT